MQIIAIVSAVVVAVFAIIVGHTNFILFFVTALVFGLINAIINGTHCLFDCRIAFGLSFSVATAMLVVGISTMQQNRKNLQ